MGGFCLLVELHRDGSAHAACAAAFLKKVLALHLVCGQSQDTQRSGSLKTKNGVCDFYFKGAFSPKKQPNFVFLFIRLIWFYKF